MRSITRGWHFVAQTVSNHRACAVLNDFAIEPAAHLFFVSAYMCVCEHMSSAVGSKTSHELLQMPNGTSFCGRCGARQGEEAYLVDCASQPPNDLRLDIEGEAEDAPADDGKDAEDGEYLDPDSAVGTSVSIWPSQRCCA